MKSKNLIKKKPRLEFTVENKQKKLGKAILKMWSQILRKNAYVSTKLILEDSAKKTKQKNESLTDFGDQTDSSGRFVRPQSEKNFPKHFSVLFSTLNSKNYLTDDLFSPQNFFTQKIHQKKFTKTLK